MHTKYKNCKNLYQTDVTHNKNREWKTRERKGLPVLKIQKCHVILKSKEFL